MKALEGASNKEKVLIGAFFDRSYLHVVLGAAAAHPPVQVPAARGGDEVVVLPRPELQTAGTRAERSGEENILIEEYLNWGAAASLPWPLIDIFCC